MASASDSTSARRIPPYLSVVPPVGKRFRKPKAVKPSPAPDPRFADIARNAEFVLEVIERLARAIREKDDLAALALADRASIEARYAAGLARSAAAP